MNQIAFALVTFLHDLFTAVWIGGLIALAVTILPSARQVFGKGPETKQLMDTVQKRHSLLVYVSIIGLVFTGILQARLAPDFQGLLRFSNGYSATLALKHILVLAMIGVALYRSLVLGRLRKSLSPTQEKLKIALLFLNLTLGIAVLALSGVIAALPVGPPSA